jgi:hypothetical protein
MAFTVQSDLGTVANANAYITVAEYKAYHDDRGNSYAGRTDPQIQTDIVRATDHIDTRWVAKGDLLEDAQTTQFPRENLFDRNGLEVEGIPSAVKKATAEYALRAGAADLEPDPDDPTAGGIQRTRDKVDVIESEVEYMAGAGPGSGLARWPAADRILQSSGLFAQQGGGGRLIR